MNSKNFALVVLILVTVFTFTACSKKKLFVLSGNIHNYYTNDPVGEVELDIQYTSLENGTYSSSFKPIEAFKANADGTFYAEFDYVSAVEFKITARKEGYITQEFIYDRSDWTVEEENVLFLPIRGASTLNVHLTNNYVQEQYLFKLLNHSEGCSSCCESGIPYSLKSFVDTVLTCSLYSDQFIDYELVNTATGESSKKTGSIMVEPGSNDLYIDLSE